MEEKPRSVEEIRAEVAAFLALFERQAQAIEQREQKIVDHFKTGVRRVGAVEIWKHIEKLVQAPSQEDLAARFDVSASVVSRGLSEGALSLENLVVILTELRLEFGVLSAALINRATFALGTGPPEGQGGPGGTRGHKSWGDGTAGLVPFPPGPPWPLA